MNKVLSVMTATLLSIAGTNVAIAEATVRLFSMDIQIPESANLGGMASYLVTVTRAGSGSLDVYLSSAGLPEGCTVAFVPPKVSFTDAGPSTKKATMVVRVPTTLRAGNYPFSVSARHGNSRNVITCANTLIVAGEALILRQPVLDIPILRSDATIGLSGNGTASQPILIQATTNLAIPNWETIAVQTLDEHGLFSLVDQDSTNYPARFYRGVQ